MTTRLYIVLALLSAAAPFVSEWRQAGGDPGGEPAAFPSTFLGERLIGLPLGEEDREFAKGFPGAVGKFTTGQNQIIIRIVERPTRQLHPASHCLKAVGFSIEPQAMIIDGYERKWGCVRATKGETRLKVMELIVDPTGQHWSDASAWFWPAALEQSSGPWIAWTVIERDGSE